MMGNAFLVALNNAGIAYGQPVSAMACGCPGCMSKLAYQAPIFDDNFAWDLQGGNGPARSQTPIGPQQVSEPNDVIPGNISTAFTLAIGGSETGVVNSVGDDDWFRVELVAGQSYVFTLTGNGGTPLTDPYLELYNSSGQLISLDDDGGPGTDALMRFTVTQSGTYYINARGWEADGFSITGGYTVDQLLDGWRKTRESAGRKSVVDWGGEPPVKARTRRTAVSFCK